MSRWTTPFRCNCVGSFLRPETLKQARADWNTGKISHEKLRRAEDVCITNLIEKQKALGYHVITDDEFCRDYWHLDFMWGLNGIEKTELDHGYYFKGEGTTHGSCRMTGKISGESHPVIRDYLFVKQFEDENTITKQTLPTPAQILAELFREDNARTTREFYLDEEELLCDLATAYHRVYPDLYATGCRNIQLDDCIWGVVVDEEGYQKIREGDGAAPEQKAEHYLKINSLSLEDLPEDLVVNTRVCHGNYHPTYASSGPCDKVAPYVFTQKNVHTLHLEFDGKRSGNLVGLKEIPHGKKMVLGFITSKRPELEFKEPIKRRIYETAQHVPFCGLCLSPQYSFASREIGNRLTEEEQFAKLRLIKEIAEEVWGKEKA